MKSERDKDARELMDYDFSKDCAYARVKNRRISNLYLHARNLSLPPEEAGSAKTKKLVSQLLCQAFYAWHAAISGVNEPKTTFFGE